MWSYLTQFWDSVSTTTLNAWEYTTDWFQNIGNAVAGAIGGLFDFAIHSFNDLIVFIGWIGSILKEIVITFLLPLQYIFTFLRSFIVNSWRTPVEPELSYTWNADILTTLGSIPYFSTLTQVVALCLGVLVIGFILKYLTQVK